MAEKKIYKFIETALTNVPKEQWATSAEVSKALLTCPRAQGIVANRIHSYKILPSLQEEIVSSVAEIMQMKMLAVLDKIDSVYYVYYKVVLFVCSNYRKKIGCTIFSPEISISNFSGENEEEFLSDIFDRVTAERVPDESNTVIYHMDLEKAQSKFAAKLATQGWPEGVQKERTRRGRPNKNVS